MKRPTPKSGFSLPPQLLPLGLTAAGIVVFYLAARYVLTPTSFGEYGWFRGAALVEIASSEPVYAGKPACEECHADEYEMLSQAEHKNLSCEVCHGPGQSHVDNPDVHEMKILTFSYCIRCHEADPARPVEHKQIDPRDHYEGDACTECHVPHQPNEVP